MLQSPVRRPEGLFTPISLRPGPNWVQTAPLGFGRGRICRNKSDVVPGVSETRRFLILPDTLYVPSGVRREALRWSFFRMVQRSISLALGVDFKDSRNHPE